jgi:hypothetical protein
MLRSAQRDLQKVAVVFVIMFLGSFYLLRLAVWDALKAVTRAEMQAQVAGAVQIIAQTPFDVILLQAKISLIAAAIVTLPVFIYVSRDALRARDLWPRAPVPTWQLLLLALAVLTLFVGGLAYGYGVFFPFVFAFLAENALNAGFAPTYSIVADVLDRPVDGVHRPADDLLRARLAAPAGDEPAHLRGHRPLPHLPGEVATCDRRGVHRRCHVHPAGPLHTGHVGGPRARPLRPQPLPQPDRDDPPLRDQRRCAAGGDPPPPS